MARERAEVGMREALHGGHRRLSYSDVLLRLWDLFRGPSV